jgi:hypothetical protein
MNYRKQMEEELLREENAWLDKLSPFMKIVDSHIGFILLSWFVIPIAFGLGLLIGLIW